FNMSKYELEDDIVLAKFINYMQLALYHRRLNYYRNLQRIQEFETNMNESIQYTDKENNIRTPDINILKNKEIYLLNLHYGHGLSYEQISAITGEKVCTLKQRRNRAIAKLKDEMEGKI
ncbi:MAG: hypothetical protein ACI310_01215, partial [Bacilli bacterium]